MNKYNSLSVGDLYVVDYYCGVKDIPPEVRDWTSKKLGSRVFNAENCERHIWFGSKEDFDDCPDLSGNKNYVARTGADAYSFLLRYMLGFVNPNGYDAPAGQRFFLGWGKISKRSPRNASRYDDVVAKLTRDYQFIEANVCYRIQPDRPWLVARDLAGQRKGDTVLVIGDTYDSKDEMTSATHRMMTTVNGTGVCPATEMLFASADPEKMPFLQAGVKRLVKQAKLRVPAQEIGFYEDFSLALEMADRVYITAPVGKYPEADAFMADCWRGRQRQTGVMVHTYPSDDSSIAPENNPFAELGNYISAQSVNGEAERRSVAYTGFAHLACEATDHMAQMRLRGMSPPRDELRTEFAPVCAIA